MRNVRDALAHIDTTIALLEQGSGPLATLYEGYSVGSARRRLISARRDVAEAIAKLASALEESGTRKEAHG